MSDLQQSDKPLRHDDPRIERQEGIVTICKPMPRNRELRLRYIGNKERLGRGKANK